MRLRRQREDPVVDALIAESTQLRADLMAASARLIRFTEALQDQIVAFAEEHADDDK